MDGEILISLLYLILFPLLALGAVLLVMNQWQHDQENIKAREELIRFLSSQGKYYKEYNHFASNLSLDLGMSFQYLILTQISADKKSMIVEIPGVVLRVKDTKHPQLLSGDSRGALQRRLEDSGIALQQIKKEKEMQLQVA